MFEALHELDQANHNLEIAIQKGNLEEVTRLINLGADVNHTPLDASVLLLAAIHKQWDIVDYLLDAGADINARTKYQVRILHFLAGDGPLNLVEKVVSFGAMINPKDLDGESAFVAAVKANRHDVVDFFLDNIGVDITCVNKKHQTTLHHCAQLGFKDMFLKLWYKGVDISLTDAKEKTAIEYIKDEDWKAELPEFEKQIITVQKEEKAKQEETKTEEAPVVDTLKASGISSIKRRAPSKAS